VTVGAAAKLAFTTQPGNGTGGSAFSTQPAVTLQDAGGNTVTGTAQDVTLAIQYNAGPGGTLSGTKTVAVNTGTGVATFSGLSIDKAGTSYTLTATGSTVSTTPGVVVSSTFDITVGAANAYRIAAFTTTPSPGASDRLTVTLVDAGGNTITSFTGDKTLTFSGLSTADDGTHPTVTDKTPSAVNVGSSELITFASGVSSAGGSLVAYKAETKTLNVSDSGGLSSDPALSTGGAGVSLTIANAAPAPASYAVTRNKGVGVMFPISDLLAACSDANHDRLSLFSMASLSRDGATVVNNPTWILYTPNGTAGDGDTFGYTISDGTTTADGTVTVHVANPTGQSANLFPITFDNNDNPIIKFAGIPLRYYDIQRADDSANGTYVTKATAVLVPSTGIATWTDTGVTKRDGKNHYYRTVSNSN
jgi:hypothetical protein